MLDFGKQQPRLSAFSVVALLVLASALNAQPGARCDEDITLIQGAGCQTPCCTEDPPHSGHFRFVHQAVENVDIRSNPSTVVSLSFPNLRTVEDRIRISFNDPDAIQAVDFPVLVSAGRIELIRNPALVDFHLPRLASLVNAETSAGLRVQSNEGLRSLSLPRLEQVLASEAGSATIELRFNPLLEAIDFPMLRSVTAGDSFEEAYIFISDNETVRHISMDDLRRLSAGDESISYMVIDDNPALEDLSFLQLTELLPTGSPDDFSEVTVGHSPNLASLSFPSLERVTVLQLSGMKGTTEAKFPRLSDLQYLWIFRSCESSTTSLKLYVCADQTFEDVVFNSDDGLCGPSGYQLHSANPANEDLCDASAVCESFTPATTECRCDAIGLCL